MPDIDRKLLTIITEALLESELCEAIDKLGATGYTVTNSSFDGYIGTEGGFYVEDNGEGKGSDDQLSLAWFNGGPGLAQATCDGLTSIEFTATSIDGGNIQVR